MQVSSITKMNKQKKKSSIKSCKVQILVLNFAAGRIHISLAKNYNFLKAQIPKTGVVISFSSTKKEWINYYN